MSDVQNVRDIQDKILVLTITRLHPRPYPHHSMSVGRVGYWDGEGAGELPYAPIAQLKA